MGGDPCKNMVMYPKQFFIMINMFLHTHINTMRDEKKPFLINICFVNMISINLRYLSDISGAQCSIQSSDPA